MSSYLFTVRFDEDGVHLDTFADYGAMHADYVASRLDPDDRSAGDAASTLIAITMRARFNSQSLYKVNYDGDELSRDSLEAILKDKQRRGLLKEFLAAARVLA